MQVFHSFFAFDDTQRADLEQQMASLKMEMNKTLKEKEVSFTLQSS